MLNFGRFFNKKTQDQHNFSSRVGRNKNILGNTQVVINAIEDGVVAIGNDSNIHLINPSAEQILGWTNGDACRLNYDSVLKIVDGEGKPILDTLNPLHKALENFKPFSSRDIHIKTQSGKVIPVFMSINPVDEQNSGIIIVFRNIAKELKENQEQAEFISTASHEMRTPVASIEGYLGLSLNPSTATIDDRARDYINKAHESAQHLGQLFQDLLDITKADDGRLKNDPKVVNVSDFTKNVWEGLKVKAEQKGLEYVFEPNDIKSGEKQLTPVFYTHADKEHLREVLDNLIDNAIKYTLRGKVSVNVLGDNDSVKITVEDSGVGIPSEDIPHLFQKFYRVDNSDTREIGGTGLGLYLSRRLTESMGGKISVESEYKKGSTFTVSLPRLDREEAKRLQAQQDSQPWQTGEVPEEEVKLTAKQFVPQQPKQVQQQSYFSAEDVAAMIRKEMGAKDEQVQEPAQASADNNTPVQPQPQSVISQTQPQPQTPIQQPPRQPQQSQQISQTPPRQQPQPIQAMPPQPRPQAQYRRPIPSAFDRPTQNSAPTLSDIEKMKEEYIKNMMAQRQNEN